MKLRSLDDTERHQVAQLIRRLRAKHARRPFFFSLRASLLAFLLLWIMPVHPMAIFIAMGGGIAISLLIH